MHDDRATKEANLLAELAFVEAVAFHPGWIARCRGHARFHRQHFVETRHAARRFFQREIFREHLRQQIVARPQAGTDKAENHQRHDHRDRQRVDGKGTVLLRHRPAGPLVRTSE
ncbi:MAG: hypothetical protein M5R36_11535 [Deltaproteobacteria bacterium]|nr:hypothetical protein [Deltaproteobacteria bacterium]